MRIAITNITGGGMSGGYKKYLQNVLPRLAVYSDVEAILCASPKSIKVQDWFRFLPKVIFITYKSFKCKSCKPDNLLVNINIHN